ncbi:GTP-binding elongation factor [Chloropicon primus]|uniref:GTP-binding elongation factor n=2 Tax=Chloropicon primus TaxID=1764295 RepID=A0A5B8MEQ2_9CHLO|nr:GTP-binding elongation factor [Chloropicon primus]UPQ97026.1 GTP-binding elongation factor [Chloropicon primus]|eukprot:QDZ17810.1 GTP-binding elongation factor [Chloropicon primus]
MSRKVGKYYDADDYDDYYDDYDDYYEDGDYDQYDDYAPPPTQSASKQKKGSGVAGNNNSSSSKSGGNQAQGKSKAKSKGKASNGGGAGGGQAQSKASKEGANVVGSKVKAKGAEGQGSSAPAAVEQPPSATAHDSRSDLSAVLQDLEIDAQAASPSKPSLMLVVLGHVDAGKSTLMGRLVAELGVVDSKEVRRRAHQANQIGKGSFGWAWLMDERPEERERGVTIDVAKRAFETDNRQVTILDAPGHRDFVTNAISGISQADAAILVIDGSVGGFESGFEKRGKISGQTREHAQLAKGIGIEQLAVVITKLDKSESGAQRFDDIRDKLEPFLKSCGYQAKSMQWLCASGTTGDNIVSKPEQDSKLNWFSGPTVVEAIDNFVMVEHNQDKPLRVPAFSVSSTKQSGGGSVLTTGRVATGCLRVNSPVTVMPGNLETHVKSIVRNNQKGAKFALAGDAVELTLGLDDLACVEIGSVVCSPADKIKASERLKVKIITLELGTPFTLGQSLIVHFHAARIQGRITKMLALHDPKSGEETKKKPRLLKSFQTATIELTLSETICVEKYEDYPSLGRLVLRLGGQTVGVGKVTKVYSATKKD